VAWSQSSRADIFEADLSTRARDPVRQPQSSLLFNLFEHQGTSLYLFEKSRIGQTRTRNNQRSTVTEEETNHIILKYYKFNQIQILHEIKQEKRDAQEELVT
jgi:hypothetical protein